MPDPLVAWMNPLPLELGPALRSRRRSLAAKASGRVLDLGGWTDHLDSYAASAVVLLGPDAERHDRDPSRVRRLDASVETLAELGVDRYDTIVSLIRTPLVSDLPRFLGALGRLLEDNGRLLLLEPVARRDAVGRALALWGRMLEVTAGLHLDRDIVSEVRGAGFFIGELHRFRVPGLSAPLRPFVEAVARLRARRSSPS